MPSIELDRRDFRGPVGNSTDKYGARNPALRFLVRRFLQSLDETLGALGPWSVLDVGCGEGVVTERIAQMAECPTVGLDFDDERLREHWRARTGSMLSFRPGSAYAIPFENDSFDVVCCLEVLEHLDRPADALREVVRVARRAVVLSVPREPHWRLSHLLAGRDLRALGNTPGHLNHWSKQKFIRFSGDFGIALDVKSPFPWTIVTITAGETAA